MPHAPRGPQSPEKPLRVVVWSTGTVGRHAIAGVDAHPDLELVGVWTSTPAKAGKDAGELAGLGRTLGVAATTSRDELLALAPDCVVHAAMTDDRVFEAIEDLTGLLRDGVNVVSSGPVILVHPQGTLPDEMVSARRGRPRGRCVAARQRHRPRLRQRRPAARDDVAVAADRPSSGQRDRRLLDVLPAVRDEGSLRLRGPLEDKPFLWEPGVLPLAWGPSSGHRRRPRVTLDEPLVEPVDAAAVEDDHDPCRGHRRRAPGSVRFPVIGSVDGSPRVALEHVTRTHAEQIPTGPPGHRRRLLPHRGHRRTVDDVDFSHHGEHGDHNVSGMIVTAKRLVNAVHAVVAAEPGLVSALDLPLITGRGLVPEPTEAEASPRRPKRHRAAHSTDASDASADGDFSAERKPVSILDRFRLTTMWPS